MLAAPVAATWSAVATSSSRFGRSVSRSWLRSQAIVSSALCRAVVSVVTASCSPPGSGVTWVRKRRPPSSPAVHCTVAGTPAATA